MRIRKLASWENGKTRALYEEVFSEDTKAFVDYYYRVCAARNQIYVWEEQGEIVAMLHLNPYRMRLGRKEISVNYIVAVATRKSHRGQGLMRGLLKKVLLDMRQQKQPFTFLMPAAEGIYTPYDFRFIYDQSRYVLEAAERTGETGAGIERAAAEDLSQLSVFAGEQLGRYQTAALHDEPYFESILEEQDCQNGEIAVIREHGEICGYYFTAREEEAQVREAVADEGHAKQLLDSILTWADGERVRLHGISFPASDDLLTEAEERVPLIMARIVNPQAFSHCLRACGNVKLYIRLLDSILEENQGIYCLTADEEGGRLIREEGYQEKIVCTLTTGQFAQLAFGYRKPEEFGMPDAFCREWKKVTGLGPVFINEVV